MSCNGGQKHFSPKKDFCAIKVYAELFMLKDSKGYRIRAHTFLALC